MCVLANLTSLHHLGLSIHSGHFVGIIRESEGSSNYVFVNDSRTEVFSSKIINDRRQNPAFKLDGDPYVIVYKRQEELHDNGNPMYSLVSAMPSPVIHAEITSRRGGRKKKREEDSTIFVLRRSPRKTK